MKIRVGCDIVEIKRFKDINKKSLEKIFHKSELKTLKPETLAGIFAAKESCKKIFNDLTWHDIEILKNKNGEPKLLLNIKKKISSNDLSISHNGSYAIAVVVFLLENGP
ncbi:MAG: holo-ACP synthase [Nanoarchaeota archaeon]|nr:holo-ACP synthase [Nanoarchaeota archaeon]